VAGASHADKVSKKRNRDLQGKITAIVATNFLCLLPFTVGGWLHFGGVYDATEHYPLFTIVILPINSVINPLLYENTIKDFVVKVCKLSAKYLRAGWNKIWQPLNSAVDTEVELSIKSR
jgi:hypothetical protein